MLIDWFTVAAQALNFAVLVWLMKRLLYRPILDAIDAREQHIAATLADADAKQAQAREARETYEHKSDAFEQQRAALLAQVTQAAEAERRRLLDEARRAAEALSAARRQALGEAAARLDRDLTRRAQQEVFAIARQTLADLATASLEERIADVFMRRLRGLDAAARQRIVNALERAPGAAVVRSAFELPTEQRARIQAALDETFGTQGALRFETAPDLVGGIELSATGQKLAWSIADYLDSLQQGVDELLQPPQGPGPR
jgi:F-type H+-transporting ATPase subunit b